MRMHYIVIWGLLVSKIQFTNYLKKIAQFSKKKKGTEHEICVLIFSKNFDWDNAEKKWAIYDQKCILVFK